MLLSCISVRPGATATRLSEAGLIDTCHSAKGNQWAIGVVDTFGNCAIRRISLCVGNPFLRRFREMWRKICFWSLRGYTVGCRLLTCVTDNLNAYATPGVRCPGPVLEARPKVVYAASSCTVTLRPKAARYAQAHPKRAADQSALEAEQRRGLKWSLEETS